MRPTICLSLSIHILTPTHPPTHPPSPPCCRGVVAHVRAKYPNNLLFAAGWSLGANILTMYLGQEGSRTPISAAASLCNPFNLVRPEGGRRGVAQPQPSSLKMLRTKQ